LVYPRLFAELSYSADRDVWPIPAATLGGLRDILGKSWSCRDLQTSAFLAPDEVRTCCQRFFVNGEMKGDVVLDVEVSRNGAVPIEFVREAKADLLRAINTGAPSACDGCPFMEFREWPAVGEEKIQYLSMEHHSVCNLRCTYCDETYYGGKTVEYDAKGTIEAWASAGALDDGIQIVWGGGEPVLDRNFERYLDVIDDYCSRPSHRFLSNSRIFSQRISSYLARGLGTLTTSVDAGTEESFIQVRGRSGFDRTLKNLKEYTKSNPHLTTVKYILTTGNMDLSSLTSFVRACEAHGLMNCSFQISVDFKFEKISWSDLSSVLMLFSELYDHGASFIFLDDLIYNRLDWSRYSLEQVLDFAGDRGFIGNRDLPREAILWGTGFQANRIAESIHLPFESVFLAATSGSEIDMHSEFHGVPVVSPREAVEIGQDVVIAAVQAVPRIRQQLIDLGLPESRIFRKLLL